MKILARLALVAALLAPSGRTAGIAFRGPQEARDGSPYPTPSPEDRATTARFVAAGEAVGVPVRDHVVVGRGRWFSFRREGLR